MEKSREKIIILGAGIYQVPLIKKAKEMGYYTIVCSIPGDYPGFQYADKIYYENTVDKEKILKIALDEKISGILTTGTDVAVKTIGYVCEKLKLNGISELSAKWTTDKFLMKKRFREGDVRTAEFYKVESKEEAISATSALGMPVIFKCVDKSGSRGIVKVEAKRNIEKAYNYAMSFTDQNYIIVEKFIEGYEIGLDGYINRKAGQEIFIPHGKVMYNNGLTKVPVGHLLPFECDSELQEDLITQARKAVDILELDESFFNMDILIRENKGYIIEVGARTGATGIPELISCFYECDFYRQMINNAVGKSVVIPEEGSQSCIAELLVSEKDGTITNIKIPQDELKDGEEISLDYGVGDKVHKFRVGPDRIGQIIVKEQNADNVMKRLEELKKKIYVRVEG